MRYVVLRRAVSESPRCPPVQVTAKDRRRRSNGGLRGVDDDAAFPRLDGDIERVSLADETHETLTCGDCESSYRLGSVLALDATYVYYLGTRELSYGAQPVNILRVARQAPGTPRPTAADPPPPIDGRAGRLRQRADALRPQPSSSGPGARRRGRFPQRYDTNRAQ